MADKHEREPEWINRDLRGFRTAEGDLLAAFILCGWEKLMPLEEATKVAEKLGAADPEKAKRLSGILVRGEKMPDDLREFVRAQSQRRDG